MSRLSSFFLPAWPAARLGVLRFLIGAYCVDDLVRARASAHAVGRGDPALWEPVGVTTWLDGPLPPELWGILWDTTAVVGVFFTTGTLWRVTGPLFAGLLLFAWTYRVSWQMIYHVHHVAMLHVLVVAVSPAAAAVSVDALLGRRWPRLPLAPGGTGESWHYGWPVRLVCIVTTLAYCLAGIAKVRAQGWGWADGHNLLDQIRYDALYKALLGRPKDVPSPLIPFLTRHEYALAPLAAGSLLLELGAPFVLFSRRLGYVWAVGAWGMHLGIWATMTIFFPYQVYGVALASFFPLERLLGRVRSGNVAPPRLRRLLTGHHPDGGHR